MDKIMPLPAIALIHLFPNDNKSEGPAKVDIPAANNTQPISAIGHTKLIQKNIDFMGFENTVYEMKIELVYLEASGCYRSGTCITSASSISYPIYNRRRAKHTNRDT